jgi:hypothetical protein
MPTRQERLAEFSSEPDRQESQVFELLCEGNKGTYVLPFACRWHDGAWWNERMGHRDDASVIGWRPAAAMSG